MSYYWKTCPYKLLQKEETMLPGKVLPTKSVKRNKPTCTWQQGQREQHNLLCELCRDHEDDNEELGMSFTQSQHQTH